MRFPRNLSQRAFDDDATILRHSLLTFGPVTASRTSDRLLERRRQITDGTAPGRRHRDIPFSRPVCYVAASPFLLFYDQGTRVVIRIVDGPRDLTAPFGDDAG